MAQELIKVTNSLDVTGSVFTVTRDKARTNDFMLREFEAEASFQQMGSQEWPEQPWTFTQKEGDVYCLVCIINIAV